MKELTDIQREMIHEKCGPFLKLIDYDIDTYKLYRGMSRLLPSPLNSSTGMDIIPGHRTDRKPKDTPIDIHNQMNDLMEAHYGRKFRNGLFISGDLLQAQGYGTSVYRVFPIGEFNFCWSDKYVDAAIGLDEHDPETLITGYYKNDDLKWAISSCNEIMLYADKCYVIGV
jgi:hypothetical protein